MKVVVIGSGVVGLCCAYELRRGGAEVSVLERGRLGQGASRGNTGWVCPSFTYPLPAPGIIGEGLRGMLRGGGPLVIHPSLDPTFLRWLLGFRRSATRERWEQGVQALLALNARTLELFDVYADGGVRFEMHRSGLLLVATTPAGLTSYTDLFRRLRSIGFTGEIVEIGPEEARALEPELAGGLAGGVHAVIDRYVRPESLTEGLAGYLAEQRRRDAGGDRGPGHRRFQRRRPHRDERGAGGGRPCRCRCRSHFKPSPGAARRPHAACRRARLQRHVGRR